MELYSHLINLRRGYMQGKGYLKHSKLKTNSIHVQNWCLNSHSKLMKEVSLDKVISQYTREMFDDNGEKCYKNMKYK